MWACLRIEKSGNGGIKTCNVLACTFSYFSMKKEKRETFGTYMAITWCFDLRFCLCVINWINCIISLPYWQQVDFYRFIRVSLLIWFIWCILVKFTIFLGTEWGIKIYCGVTSHGPLQLYFHTVLANSWISS